MEYNTQKIFSALGFTTIPANELPGEPTVKDLLRYMTHKNNEKQTNLIKLNTLTATPESKAGNKLPLIQGLKSRKQFLTNTEYKDLTMVTSSTSPIYPLFPPKAPPPSYLSIPSLPTSPLATVDFLSTAHPSPTSLPTNDWATYNTFNIRDF